ncbi:general transcription factor II-I repeat domain-containing protein 2A-like [Watersipora subatra]|uniref:general transcription factor II-I repeat domain-containing protein 2A-like n=1 Tax=Watersipora subatra TaxID=2589382 RepID=UPI00355C1868
MSATEKRKVDVEGKVFNKDWSSKYFVVEPNKGVICVICQATIAVLKEYNIKRHYTSIHSASYDTLLAQYRLDKLEQMTAAIKKQQGMFTSYKKESELVTKLGFKVCELLAEKEKPLSDGEFLSDNIDETLKERIQRCTSYSLAIDKSTDVNDTAKLVVFIRGITDNFEIIEEFLDMASMSSRTTGQDICDQVMKLMDKFELDPSRLAGLTTDGAPSMIKKINGFTKKFLDAIGPPELVVNHCIIHQDNLCTKILGFTDVMKSVVKFVN